MKRVTWILIGVAALSFAAVAYARHGGGHQGWWKGRVNAHIDDALDIADATPQQKEKIYAARDRAFEELQKAHQGRPQEIDRLLKIFEADQLDNAALDQLRAEHQAAARAAADAVTRAITDAHGTLDAKQRDKIANWAKRHIDSRLGGGSFGGDWMRNRALSHVDRVLDRVNATDAQKTSVRAAVTHVLDTARDSHKDVKPLADKALALFRADKLDPAAVEALRNESQARHAKLGDAVAQAIHDAHAALTPQQRKALVAEARKFGEHRKGRHHRVK